MDIPSRDLNTQFTLDDFKFAAVKLTKNNDPDIYGYSGSDIGFDAYSLFHCQLVNCIKLLVLLVWIIVHQDELIIEKNTQFLGEGPTDGLDNTAAAAGAKYSVDLTKSRKEICLSLHYNATNSFFCIFML